MDILRATSIESQKVPLVPVTFEKSLLKSALATAWAALHYGQLQKHYHITEDENLHLADAYHVHCWWLIANLE